MFVIEENLELEVAVSSASLTEKVDAPGRTWTCMVPTASRMPFPFRRRADRPALSLRQQCACLIPNCLLTPQVQPVHRVENFVQNFC